MATRNQRKAKAKARLAELQEAVVLAFQPKPIKVPVLTDAVPNSLHIRGQRSLVGMVVRGTFQAKAMPEPKARKLVNGIEPMPTLSGCRRVLRKLPYKG